MWSRLNIQKNWCCIEIEKTKKRHELNRKIALLDVFFYIHFLQFLKYRDSQLDTYLSSSHSHWSVLNFIDIFFLIFDLKISRQKLRNIWQWKIERELFRNFIYSVTKLFLWLWSWIWIALPCAQYSVIRKKKFKKSELLCMLEKAFRASTRDINFQIKSKRIRLFFMWAGINKS